MATRKKSATKKQPAPTEPAKTRFRISYTFDLEVDGVLNLPNWTGPGYLRFIVAGLQGLGISVPVTVLQPSSCSARIREPNTKERGGRMIYVGGKFTDDGTGKRVVVHGKRKLVLLDRDGKVIP
jgi:hypothetical protein